MSTGWIATGSVVAALITAFVLFIKTWPEIRQIVASARQSTVAAAVAQDARDDEHLELIIRTQSEFMLAPLKQDITDLRTRIGELEGQMRTMRAKYNAALAALRGAVRHGAILAGLLNDAGLPYPPPPSIPADIHDDM